ncbi:hypothetical protein C7974DRAFT_316333 [Boeremia exigua]|uniref:uncharacterized protein n=1 Tax=Boeremia exigua TaxID=749465 RepID=UPI001E8D7AA8|nr:uncharacterized protein C7974DRAFT_316333 [Boeremia exigua]KAH6619960.1 hypothetical protein C7974DRAFT_316333 [Boeremia exigua]
MVTRRTSEVPDLTAPAPLAKRKRRASCLGEQERRERKRAIDREAQRSLREKTKTHIAELERTIQILRDQDRNGATANLLSEIDGLRAENERLRDIIDSVKSALGSDGAPRAMAATEAPGASGGAYRPVGRSPKPRAASSISESKPSLPTPTDLPTSYDFRECTGTRTVDLDGMPIMGGMPAAPTLDMDLDNEVIEEVPSTELFFGDGWRCPSPTILHIGAPGAAEREPAFAVCPIWKKSNELFECVYSTRGPSAVVLQRAKLSASAEAGLLYQGIKDGWSSLPSSWTQSPALRILQQVDEFLFSHLPKMERLATAYKSFKLLQHYLNPVAAPLAAVPPWLRPSPTQSTTHHPIAIDFFAWPTLRDRLVAEHASFFQSSALSHVYSRYLRFDWPFAFEDAFCRGVEGGWVPSPLFERYHGDLGRWGVGEEFYEGFPMLRGDIEGDRRRFAEDGGV